MKQSKDFEASVTKTVREALREDIGSGDISAELIDVSQQATARVITRQGGIFCGRPWVDEVCAQLDPNINIRWRVDDGEEIAANQELLTLAGPARALLTAERTLLNFIQLLSGTATLTRRYVELLSSTRTKLLDTRKTIPGLRLAQKYAVRCGGGHNHRIGLYDAFLIKENHINAAGGITAAVERARSQRPDVTVEVEVENLEELQEAIEAGADIALIDNFSLVDTAHAVAMAEGKLELEASGAIDERKITDISKAGVHYISIGILTKQVIPLDLSMRFLEQSTGNE